MKQEHEPMTSREVINQLVEALEFGYRDIEECRWTGSGPDTLALADQALHNARLFLKEKDEEGSPRA
jgi:hypothetical protein